MKIRIQGNTIRLRLSQGEVNALNEVGQVEESIQFGATPQETLRYTLQKADVREMGVSYAGHEMKVFVPAGLVCAWAETDQVGLEQEMNLGEGKSLRILVEKDFKCLTPRQGEDENDNFPNPKASC
jgi:hypothetical protein